MANVLNRTTLEYLTSVDTGDYPAVDWVINPDMTPVNGVPSKYWKLTGDVVSEMTQAEKDAVDAADLPGVKVTKKVAVATSVGAYIAGVVGTSDRQRSLLMLYSAAQDSGKVNRAAHIKPSVDWVESVLSDYTARMDTVDAAADETAANAVSEDFTNNDASIPATVATVKSALAIPD